jgi:hypothetical protein
MKGSARRTFCVIAMAMSVLTTAEAATAQTEVQSEATSRFQEGVQRFKSGDYEGAVVSFEQAWALVHDEQFLWNQALSELNAGRNLDALKHLEQCRSVPGVTASHLAQIDAAVREARSRLTLLAIRAPEGSTVTVDGQRVGTAPLGDPIAVDPSQAHTVSATMDGAQDVRSVIPHSPGSLEVVLVPPAPPRVPAVAPASLAPAPPPHAGIDPVRVGVSGTLLAGGIATGIVALVFGVRSTSEENDANAIRAQFQASTMNSTSYCVGSTDPRCRALAADNQNCASDHNTSIATGVTAGVLVAGSVATWFLWPHAQAKSIAVVPDLGRGRLGLEVTSTF